MYAAFDRAFAMLDLAPYCGARIFFVRLRQLAQQLLDFFVLYLGRLDRDFHDLIASLILARAHDAFFAEAELLPILRSLRDFQKRTAVDGRNLDLRAQPS